MVEVICDTNFLIHLATRRIKNIDNLDMEIGSISFIVPEVVKNELVKLQQVPEKTQEITTTLNFKGHKGEIIFDWNVNIDSKEIESNNIISKNIINLVDFYD